MLRIITDPAPIWASNPRFGKESATPYHVQTSQGVTLASFKTKGMAESYRKSALLAVALDLQLAEISDRRSATEEETLP